MHDHVSASPPSAPDSVPPPLSDWCTVEPDQRPADENMGPRGVGSGERTVKAGETLYSICRETGNDWATVWDHSDNAELRRSGRTPGLLAPGDRIHLPAATPRSATASTSTCTTFCVRPDTLITRVRLILDDSPAHGRAVIIRLPDGDLSTYADDQGVVEFPLRGDERRATLEVQHDGETLEIELNIGALDPVTELTGVQARLNNLGFGCGEADGVLGPETRAALARFRSARGIVSSAILDDVTRRELTAQHGS